MSLFKHNPESEYFFDEGCYILETLNDSGDPDASIVRARVAPGVTTQWHRLNGITERYVVLEGRGRAWVGNEQHDVGPGDMVLIPALTRQRITNTGTADLIFLAVCTPRFEAESYMTVED